MTDRQPRSALALEIGPTHARALLVERVDGHARLVAAGEAPAVALGEMSDAATAARAAIAQVEAATGRVLFAQGGVLRPRRTDGAGVDVVSLVVDAPLAVGLAGCGDRGAVAAAGQVVASLGLAADEPITLRASDDPADLVRPLRRRSTALDARPNLDVLVLLGPADAAAFARLSQALALAAPAGPSAAPVVVWAGEAAGAEVARVVLGGRAQLRVVEPVVPRPDVAHTAPLRAELLALWGERIELAVAGADAVARWADAAPLPRHWSEGLALGQMAADRAGAVWLARVAPEGAIVRHATPIDPATVETGRHGVAGISLRKLRPWTLLDDAPAVCLDATISLAEAAAGLPASSRPNAGRGQSIVIGAGDIALLPAEDAVRALVDGLEPRGAVQVAVDELDGLAALGGLAGPAPALAADVLATDLLRPMAGLVAPGWRARPGAAVFRFRATTDGKSHEPVEIGVGETRRVRLGEGEQAQIRAERAAWWDLRRFFGGRIDARLEGGPIGLVLDGRARPAAGPLSFGRETIGDDAAAARFTGDLIPTRTIVAEPSHIRRLRPVPRDARMLVGPGERVGADELIAHPHDGDGSVHEVIPAGRALGVGDPRPFLTVAAGGKVAAGDVIARRTFLFGLVKREVRAPIDGVLQPELAGFGNLAIVVGGAPSGVVAHLPGTVVGVLPEGVVIEATGLLVGGAIGFGPPIRGPLLAPVTRLDAGETRRQPGAVAVVDVLDRLQLDLLVESGASGAVVGSITRELADELLANPPSVGIVAVEGVGTAPLCAPACALLAGRTGQLACLTPGEPGDRRSRPEVIVPVPTDRARQPAEPKLVPGATVRVVGETTALGRVVAVGALPEKSAVGIRTRHAEIELESGERTRAPLANLELVS